MLAREIIQTKIFESSRVDHDPNEPRVFRPAIGPTDDNFSAMRLSIAAPALRAGERGGRTGPSSLRAPPIIYILNMKYIWLSSVLLVSSFLSLVVFFCLVLPFESRLEGGE
jgi:hypothetical protein